MIIDMVLRIISHRLTMIFHKRTMIVKFISPDNFVLNNHLKDMYYFMIALYVLYTTKDNLSSDGP